MTDHFMGFHPIPMEPSETPRGLGAAMAGSKGPLSVRNPQAPGQQVPRRQHDFYPTPAPVITALMLAEQAAITAHTGTGPRARLIWEPCGRGGGI